jgi:WD40 repeat protein
VELGGRSAPVATASFSADGIRLVTAGGNARVWDAATGRQLVKLHGGPVLAARFSPDGRYVVTDDGSKVAIYKIVLADDAEKLFPELTRR